MCAYAFTVNRMFIYLSGLSSSHFLSYTPQTISATIALWSVMHAMQTNKLLHLHKFRILEKWIVWDVYTKPNLSAQHSFGVDFHVLNYAHTQMPMAKMDKTIFNTIACDLCSKTKGKQKKRNPMKYSPLTFYCF